MLNNFLQTVQTYVKDINGLMVAVCQVLAIFVITIGISKALMIYIKDAMLGANAAEAIKESRLELGHSFSLGLGFLIGGSILRTTLAPSWDDIGQLAAVIAIRTILNHLLLRDISKHVVNGQAEILPEKQPEDAAENV
jgi:uncharacterized membrane protein